MAEDDALKKSDMLKLLEVARDAEKTGKWEGIFTYPNCGWDLVRCGLATEDKKVTPAGHALLWFMGKGEDPTADSQSSVAFTIPLNKRNTP